MARVDFPTDCGPMRQIFLTKCGRHEGARKSQWVSGRRSRVEGVGMRGRGGMEWLGIESLEARAVYEEQPEKRESREERSVTDFSRDS